VPVVILVARKLDLSLMKVGIPALAGLSILHGFVPPHPGPLLAIDIVKADLSTVLLYGLVISVPTLIVSGPLLARFVDQWVPVHASGAPGGSDAGPTQTQTHSQPQTSASEASLVWQARQMSPGATSCDMSTVPLPSTTSTRPAPEISKVLSWRPYSSAFWAIRPTFGTEPIVVGSKAPLTRQSSMTVW
jgi:GntP family gluconate:H+ symporter